MREDGWGDPAYCPMVAVKRDDRPVRRPGQPRDGFFGYPSRVRGDGDDPGARESLEPLRRPGDGSHRREVSTGSAVGPADPFPARALERLGEHPLLGLRTDYGITLRQPLFCSAPGIDLARHCTDRPVPLTTELPSVAVAPP